MKIKQIHIKYFRSIYNQTIDVDSLNILVGLNDSGKSNLLKALNLFFNGETGWKEPFNFRSDFNLKRSQEFMGPSAPQKAKEISIKLTFEKMGNTIPVWEKRWRMDGHVIETMYDSALKKSERHSETGFKRNSRVPSMLRKVTYLYVPALKGSEYISHLIGKLSNVLSEKASDDIREAAAGFETNLAQYLQDITDVIQTELDIQSLLKLPYDLVTIFENMEFSDTTGVPLTHRGDGVRTRHIPILLDKISKLYKLLRDKKELFDHFIWGYEEPENNVEMNACFGMAERFFSVYAKEHQIFLSTHSPAFYSLPERVVGNDWKQGVEGIYRYMVSQENRTTKYVDASEKDLDPYFLLPAASRVLEGVHNQIECLKKINAELQSKADFFDKPCLIVEGESDKIILEKAIDVFFPAIKENIKIHYPLSSEHGGGGDFVANHLIAWELKQKHLPSQDRIKAVGFFDDDEAGNKGRSRFCEVIQTPSTVFPLSYKYMWPSSSHLHKLKNSNLKASIPCVLESLYSPEFWEIAYQKKWLVENPDLVKFIPNEVMSNLAVSSKTLADLCDDNLSRYCTHKFDKHKKVLAAKEISSATSEDAQKYLCLFEGILRSALVKLTVLSN